MRGAEGAAAPGLHQSRAPTTLKKMEEKGKKKGKRKEKRRKKERGKGKIEIQDSVADPRGCHRVRGPFHWERKRGKKERNERKKG